MRASVVGLEFVMFTVGGGIFGSGHDVWAASAVRRYRYKRPKQHAYASLTSAQACVGVLLADIARVNGYS